MGKKGKLFFALFLLIGLGLLAGAGALALHTRAFLAQAVRAPGTVLELDWRRSDNGRVAYPVVGFQTADGQQIVFTENAGSSPPAYDEGEAVEVFYLADRPHEAKLDGVFSLWGGSLILGGIGLVFTLVGGGGFAFQVASGRSAERLRQQGTRVQAKFTGVERNTSYKVNGRSPWQLTAQWQDPRTGLLHVFKSENLWFDPTPYVDRQELTVFVDLAKPKRHLVDLSFLPKLAA
ncbi:MAG: DUF3592 domain-containing protein [Anaeromyxobacter sp.]